MPLLDAVSTGTVITAGFPYLVFSTQRDDSREVSVWLAFWSNRVRECGAKMSTRSSIWIISSALISYDYLPNTDRNQNSPEMSSKFIRSDEFMALYWRLKLYYYDI